MDGSLWNYWGQHDMSSVCFGLGNDMEHNRTRFQQQQVSKEFESKFPFTEPSIYVEHSTPHHHNVPRRPHEEDQVVPSFQRLTVLEGQHRDPCKPLPPLPDPEELMSDEAADSEVEFFTCSDRRRLLPKGYSKAPCYGSPTRGSSFKDFGQVNYGQVNYAYQDSSCSASSSSGGGADCKAHFWASAADDSSAARGCVAADSGTSAGVNSWTIGGVNYRSQRGQQCQKEHDSEQMMTAVREITASKLPDCHMQPSRRRFSYSGPTHHHHHPQSLSTPCATDKPEVPPRIPIRPKPSTLSKTIADEWSLSNEQDKPPKIPPRVPLVPVCPPRTPSPKSLPLYVNGVMPATQSFAPNPKYVSRAQQRQQSERAPPADQCSPCIVPIMKDGRQASTTHYFLLPGRPAYMGRLERLLSEPDRKDNTGTEWSCQNR